MNTCRFNLRYIFSCDIKPLALFFISAIGFVLGIALSYCDPILISEINRAELISRPSLPLLLVVNIAPVFLVYYFLKLSLPSLCYLLAFLLCLSSGYCDMSLIHLFGDGAWLLRVLLLFSRHIVLTLWWLLLFLNVRRFRTYLILAIWILTVSITDVYVIAPFISNICFNI